MSATTHRYIICHALAHEEELYMPSFQPGKQVSYRELFWEHLWASKTSQSGAHAASSDQDFQIKVKAPFAS